MKRLTIIYLIFQNLFYFFPVTGTAGIFQDEKTILEKHPREKVVQINLPDSHKPVDSVIIASVTDARIFYYLSNKKCVVIFLIVSQDPHRKKCPLLLGDLGGGYAWLGPEHGGGSIMRLRTDKMCYTAFMQWLHTDDSLCVITTEAFFGDYSKISEDNMGLNSYTIEYMEKLSKTSRESPPQKE